MRLSLLIIFVGYVLFLLWIFVLFPHFSIRLVPPTPHPIELWEFSVYILGQESTNFVKGQIVNISALWAIDLCGYYGALPLYHKSRCVKLL